MNLARTVSKFWDSTWLACRRKLFWVLEWVISLYASELILCCFGQLPSFVFVQVAAYFLVGSHAHHYDDDASCREESQLILDPECCPYFILRARTYHCAEAYWSVIVPEWNPIAFWNTRMQFHRGVAKTFHLRCCVVGLRPWFEQSALYVRDNATMSEVMVIVFVFLHHHLQHRSPLRKTPQISPWR